MLTIKLLNGLLTQKQDAGGRKRKKNEKGQKNCPQCESNGERFPVPVELGLGI